MTWMPLPPPDRLVPRRESTDVSQIPSESERTRVERGEARGLGLWVIVGLFLVSLLLLLFTPGARG